MYWWFKWIILICLAIWIEYSRHKVSKLPRTRTSDLPYFASSQLNDTDVFEYYNRNDQYKNSYLDMKHTIFSRGLCGNLQTPPMKRPCTPFFHLHLYQQEEFTLLQGELTYRLGDEIFACNVQTCPSPIVVAPLVPHTFWMNDNKEDLILRIRVAPIHKNHGIRAESFESITGVRRDNYMNIWQALVFLDSIETYPVRLPLSLVKVIIKVGSIIGRILGYQTEYEEYSVLSL